MLEQVEIGRLYRNKKNGALYKVLGTGRYTEEPMEMEPMVYYQAMHRSTEPFWIRPFELFAKKFELVTDREEALFYEQYKRELGEGLKFNDSSGGL